MIGTKDESSYRNTFWQTDPYDSGALEKHNRLLQTHSFHKNKYR